MQKTLKPNSKPPSSKTQGSKLVASNINNTIKKTVDFFVSARSLKMVGKRLVQKVKSFLFAAKTIRVTIFGYPTDEQLDGPSFVRCGVSYKVGNQTRYAAMIPLECDGHLHIPVALTAGMYTRMGLASGKGRESIVGTTFTINCVVNGQSTINYFYVADHCPNNKPTIDIFTRVKDNPYTPIIDGNCFLKESSTITITGKVQPVPWSITERLQEIYGDADLLATFNKTVKFSPRAKKLIDGSDPNVLQYLSPADLQ